MAKKITKKEFLEITEKINKNAATPEEKLKLLKILNNYLDKSNSFVEDLIKAMKEQIF
jgi:hypothetical protein